MSEHKGVFFEFMQELSEEDREMFLRALDENDLMDYSSSEEEFRLVTGRNPKFPFDAKLPKKGIDVENPQVTKEILQERLNEVMEAFSKKKPESFDDLKKLADDEDLQPNSPQSFEELKDRVNPKIEVNITMNMIREKAGLLSSTKN